MRFRRAACRSTAADATTAVAHPRLRRGAAAATDGRDGGAVAQQEGGRGGCGRSGLLRAGPTAVGPARTPPRRREGTPSLRSCPAMLPVWLLAELFNGAHFFSTLVPSGRKVDSVLTQCLVVFCRVVGCVNGCVFSPARRPAVVPSVRIYISIVQCLFVHVSTMSRDSSSIRVSTSCAVTAAASAGTSPPLLALVLVLFSSLKAFPREALPGLAPPSRPVSRLL